VHAAAGELPQQPGIDGAERQSAVCGIDMGAALIAGFGAVNMNVKPGEAEVWIDGQKVGETPIGNLSVSVGAHEIIFRHPDLGEQRQTVTVTLATPARVTIDLRKK
jgi:hypothetical protein